MSNLSIYFSRPLLLLLLIPAIAIVLIPYFLLSKRYRRNRNRIVSLVLHLVALTSCIFVVSGMGFAYSIVNESNEMILLVDSTYSTQQEQEAKDSYIQQVIGMCDSSSVKLGIVTFGYNQVYALPLTNDLTEAYQNYITAEQPNSSATDIAAALQYAREKFTNTESAKIVLISDGVETDEKALSVIRSIAADGIQIDTILCSSYVPETEVRLLSAQTPNYNVVVDEPFEVEVTLKNSSSTATEGTITLYDNDEQVYSSTIALASGLQTVTLPHTFTESNLHILRVEITSNKDSIAENNSLYTYMYLEEHSKVLIIESKSGESNSLSKILSDYTVTVKNAKTDTLPTTLDELRAYDEVILNNIANSDLPEGFDEILNAYVYQVGGGLFTVGGGETDDPETAHAYNRDDLSGTLLQQMLPVQAINYTPPLGLAIIVDISGSMTMPSGDITKLDAAKNSALTIVRDEACLSERDYCAVLTLSDSYTVETKPLPMTRQEEIIDSIYQIGTGGSTSFAPAIKKASTELRALYEQGSIEKMHVIVITDGIASDFDDYYAEIQRYYAQGVTFSFVAIEATESSMSQLQQSAEAGGGQAINSKATDLTAQLRKDICVDSIKEVEYGEFTPTIKDESSVYAQIFKDSDVPTLNGFYGTKARADADVILAGAYNVPIYAQWKYGAGMVGSFMCDLNGVWSGDFISAETGSAFITSVINKLFPLGNIRPTDIEVRLTEDNYTTNMSIYTSTQLSDSESVTVNAQNLTSQLAAGVVSPSSSDGYSRATFYTDQAGVYKINVSRLNEAGQVVSEYSFYKAFSYSKEYDEIDESVDYAAAMQQYAELANGQVLSFTDDDIYNVFNGFATSLARSFDPTLVLIILAVVVFLLDIAVRKFKFKWIHEIVAEHKKKKASAN